MQATILYLMDTPCPCSLTKQHGCMKETAMLVEECGKRGIIAERLFGEKELRYEYAEVAAL